ncbi:MAG: TolC family protein [Polaribacter sp.]|uniref:TolC family protein n=1 Tax=Polaribacter sp. TaxID=1920175 RepID=UPI002F35A08D
MKTKLILLVALITSIATFSQKKWTLKECVDEALKKNISIQQNQLSVELAKKSVEIAKGNFLPNLSGNFGNSANFGLSTGVDNTRSSADRYSLSLGLNGGGTIFNGFRNTNTYKQAKLGVETSLLDLKQIENDISLRVVNTYLNVLFAKENLEVAKVQAEISKKQIEAANARFKAGVIAKGELLNFQSTAANDLQNVVTQENALDLALLNLAQLLQESVENFDVAPIDVGSPSANLLYANSSSVFQKSLNYMPEIANAELAIENAGLNIELAKGAFLPTLSYSFGANSFYNTVFGQPEVITGVDNSGNPFVIDNRFANQIENNLGYSIGVSLNVPIFNRFQTKNRVAQSVINREISETRLESQKLILKQTIEQAFLDVKSSLKAFEAAKISLEAQKEAFKNAQERYNYGAMTLFDFDLVRTRLVNAEGLMIRSKYDYVFKTKVLQFYSGELVLE